MDKNIMKINTARGKTEFMQMSRWKQEHNIYTGADKIYQTDSYKYIGVEIGYISL